MQVSKISEILDLALTARELGYVFNPMFVGEAGIGKSEAIQQWVEKQRLTDPDFQFIDLRLAYYEGPDLIGYPYQYVDELGNQRMGHALPHMWPTHGRGLILLEEPNRGNEMVQNCLMQLTDFNRKVGPTYKLPDGFIIASALNPEGTKYSVNSMDTALKNRFEHFEVDFNFNTFLAYIEKANWHHRVVQFVKSGNWVYKKSDSIGKDGVYISPRTLSRLNTIEHSLDARGVANDAEQRSLHYTLCLSLLGKYTGNEYWKTCWDDAPITAMDLIKDKEKALEKLKKMTQDKATYAGDKVNLTVDSIVEKYGGWFEGRKKDGKDFPHDSETIDEPTMAEVAKMIPSDHAINLIKGCGLKLQKGNITSFLADFVSRNPDCVAILREHIKFNQALKK